MTLRAVRVVVIVVCGLGITGMIATQITKHDGASITFGLITAVAILCSMVATAVARGGPSATGGPVGASAPGAPGALRAPSTDAASEDGTEQQAARVEEGVARLVESGADEAILRALVRDAVRLGRHLPNAPE